MAGARNAGSRTLAGVGSLGLVSGVSKAERAVGVNAGDAASRARPLGLDVESMIGRALRGSVLLAAVLLIGGLLLLLGQLSASEAHPTLTSVLAPGGLEADPLRSPAEVLAGLGRREPNALIDLGLFVLMATPIVSILISGLQFFLERDAKFVTITLALLGIIAASFFLSTAR